MVERPSATATMHLAHYLIGFGFYGGVVLAAWCEGAGYLGVWFPDDSLPVSHGITPLSWFGPLMIVAVVVFGVAWVTQYRLHQILASLRNDPGSAGKYSIPRGSWFELVVCPHYLCDVLVYFALCLLTRFKNKALIYATVWTVVNLGIVAWETDRWYRIQFGDDLRKAFPHGRWRMIPPLY